MTRKKKQINPTVLAFRQGAMTMRVRLEMLMWNKEHLLKNAECLERLANELRRISQSNSLRGVDQCILAQRATRNTNWDMQKILPADPRGAHGMRSECMEYVGNRHYAVDTNGHDKLNARKDLDEPHTSPNYRSGLD